MKKPLTGLIWLLAGTLTTHSQGTVSLGNYLALHSYIYVSFKPYNGPAVELGGHDGTTTGAYELDAGNGNDWTVALYGYAGAGDALSTLQECTVAGGGFATATFANGTTDNTAGTWYSSVVAQIPGTTGANEPATLQLYVWYNDGGTLTLAQAEAAGDPFGASALVTLSNTGGNNLAGGPPIIAPNLPAGLGNFEIALVPEPETVPLGLMGAATFFLHFRQRK